MWINWFGFFYGFTNFVRERREFVGEGARMAHKIRKKKFGKSKDLTLPHLGGDKGGVYER